MSTPTTEELIQLSEQVVSFPPEVAERRPSTFLSLAPATSDSYPRTQKSKQALTAEALAAIPKQASTDTIIPPMKRRTSSLGSDESKSRLRFLRLGPVHWGEHQDDNKADFHDIDICCHCRRPMPTGFAL